jgi:hypothetical protein
MSDLSACSEQPSGARARRAEQVAAAPRRDQLEVEGVAEEASTNGPKVRLSARRRSTKRRIGWYEAETLVDELELELKYEQQGAPRVA